MMVDDDAKIQIKKIGDKAGEHSVCITHFAHCRNRMKLQISENGSMNDGQETAA